MSLCALSCQKEEKAEGADKRYREVVDINEKGGKQCGGHIKFGGHIK